MIKYTSRYIYISLYSIIFNFIYMKTLNMKKWVTMRFSPNVTFLKLRFSLDQYWRHIPTSIAAAHQSSHVHTKWFFLYLPTVTFFGYLLVAACSMCLHLYNVAINKFQSKHWNRLPLIQYYSATVCNVRLLPGWIKKSCLKEVYLYIVHLFCNMPDLTNIYKLGAHEATYETDTFS